MEDMATSDFNFGTSMRATSPKRIANLSSHLYGIDWVLQIMGVNGAVHKKGKIQQEDEKENLLSAGMNTQPANRNENLILVRASKLASGEWNAPLIRDSFLLDDAQEILRLLTGVSVPKLGKFFDFLLVCYAQLATPKLEQLLVLLWRVWYRRNRFVHTGLLDNSEDILCWSNSFLHDFQVASPVSSVANLIIRDLPSWVAPPPNVFKLNSDAAKHGLLLALASGLCPIVVETDAKTLVEIINSKSTTLSEIGIIIDAIHHLLYVYFVLSVSYTPKSTNKVADILANLVVQSLAEVMQQQADLDYDMLSLKRNQNVLDPSIIQSWISKTIHGGSCFYFSSYGFSLNSHVSNGADTISANQSLSGDLTIVLCRWGFCTRLSSSQSFDHPAHTWLPGMKIGLNKRTNENQLLTSWKNKEDPAPGLKDSGAVDLGMVKQMNWLDGPKSWFLFWAQPRKKCEVYALCGAFGLCNEDTPPFCVCMQHFKPKSELHWNLEDYAGGCERKTQLQCGNNSLSREKSDRFLESPNMVLPKHPQSVAVGSIEECETACFNNCTCNAYAYENDECSIWIGDLLSLQQLAQGDTDGKTIYIKLAASEFSSSKDNKGMVIGAVVGSMAFVVLLGLVLPKLEGNADVEELSRICKLACWCIQDDESHRPSMGQVVQILEGIVDVTKPPIPRSLQLFVDNQERIIFFTESSSGQSSQTRSNTSAASSQVKSTTSSTSS
ncbi:hypothetical protein JRO89_XS01G0158800 [Xanthoceras sorbifolium]|uniref:Apple domain-containing protein n=1 Tax=Xanthoceras sorbifolium TaxID=99658 RepID=A0ABQ8IKD9_9ROSI|nr:hypothetical protein JRO89_XS01G0158800 [Xanthoceras sorbifolium]